jgi:hypothetical protein
MIRQFSDNEPAVIGGGVLPDRLLDASLDESDVPVAEIDREIHWLLTLNAGKVQQEFRKGDLTRMDDETKRTLMSDIQHALGIPPFLKDKM